MERQRTRSLKFIVAGIAGTILMLVCLAGFIVNAVTGNGINNNPASDKIAWNSGMISMKYSTHIDGVWKMNFKSASDGFIEQEDMKIEDADTQALYADISCETVPEGATLILWLVQGDISRSVNVTELAETLEYPLNEFRDGKIHVRLQINGVEDTSSEIYIQ